MISHYLFKFDMSKIRRCQLDEGWSIELDVQRGYPWRPECLVIYKGDDAFLTSIKCANQEVLMNGDIPPAFLFHIDHDFEYIRAALQSGFSSMIINQLPPLLFPTMKPDDTIVVSGRGPIVAMAIVICVATED